MSAAPVTRAAAAAIAAIEIQFVMVTAYAWPAARLAQWQTESHDAAYQAWRAGDGQPTEIIAMLARPAHDHALQRLAGPLTMTTHRPAPRCRRQHLPPSPTH